MEFFFTHILVGYIVLPALLIAGIIKLRKDGKNKEAKTVTSFLVIWLILRTIYLIYGL